MANMKGDQVGRGHAETGAIAARANPFAMHRLEQLPFRFAAGDWGSHLARLAKSGWRGAIVGPHGSGKTTLLLELRGRLHGPDQFDRKGFHRVNYLFLDRSRREIDKQIGQMKSGRGMTEAAIWLVDGFERLGFWQRLQLLRATKGQGLVVTAHHPCRLPTWIHTSTSVELLEDLVAELGIRDRPAVRAAVQAAWRESGGNLRDALRRLYDRAASISAGCDRQNGDEAGLTPLAEESDKQDPWRTLLAGERPGPN